MLRRLTLPATVAALTAIALMGSPACRRAPRTATPRPRVSACSLLSAGEVSTDLGGPAGAPEATADDGADVLAGRSGCAWTTVDQSRAVLIELVRTRDISGSVRRTGFSANARFAAARSRHPSAIAVANVGRDAIWVDESATMYVLSDGSYLTFEVAVPTPSDAIVVATALASAAVGHLGTAANQAN